MQNQQMMGIFFKARRHAFIQFPLHFQHILPRPQTGTVGQPENMGIHRNSWQTKCSIQNHIGRLATHAGQRFQRLPLSGHFTAMLLDQGLTQLDDIGRLAVKQSDGFDVLLQTGFTQRQNRFWRIGNRKQQRGSFVDPFIGGLG